MGRVRLLHKVQGMELKLSESEEGPGPNLRFIQRFIQRGNIKIMTMKHEPKVIGHSKKVKIEDQRTSLV